MARDFEREASEPFRGICSIARSRTLRSVLGAALVLLAASSPGALAEDPDLSSPRATFGTFLEAMGEVKRGKAGRIDDAVGCLDLSELPSLVLGEAPRLAGELKTYLDKVELIDVQSLPAEVEEARWIYRRTPAGEVSLTVTDDGRWLFSQETIAALPSLLDSVRGKSFAKGIEGGGGAPVSLAQSVRGRLPETLQKRVFILENWQWLSLIVLAFLGVIVDRIVRVVLAMWLRRLLAGSERLRQKGADVSFERPMGILAMSCVWWVGLSLLDLPMTALATLRFAAQLVMAAAGVWAVYRLVDLVSAHFAALAARTQSKIDDILVPMLRRAVKIVVLAFVILFVAQNLDIDITSLLAGLGIGGIAFALAAKDTVENLFGSLTVLIDRPFQIGDWVVIGDQEGTVEEIGFRSTRVRTFYNSLITIPNATLVNAAVDNLGVRRYRRVKCMLSVQYDTSPAKIEAFCEGIRELIRQHPYTRKDYYMVYLNAFSASSLDILLYAFHEAPDWATELRERHRLFVDIIRLAQRLGVDFAFPTRTLHVASALSGVPGEPPPEQEANVALSEAVRPDDAVRLGRAEAESIMSELWKGEPQPPVSFADPDRIPPGRHD